MNYVNVPSTDFIEFHQAVNAKNLSAEFIGFDAKGQYIYSLTKNK